MYSESVFLNKIQFCNFLLGSKVVVVVVGSVVVVNLRNRSSAILKRKSLADETALTPIMVEIMLSMLLPAVTTPKKANNKPAVDMMSA